MQTGKIIDLQYFDPQSPWQMVDEGNRDVLKKELENELHERHSLFAKNFEVIARRNDQDDIAVFLGDDHLIAFIHLTWSSKSEIGMFPITVYCRTWAEVEEIMRGKDA